MSRRSIRKRRHRAPVLVIIDELSDPPDSVFTAFRESFRPTDGRVFINGAEFAQVDRIEYT